YAKASVVYGDGFYARIARRTLDYVLREMTDPATGAFFSAQDAEVDGREGLNYLWTAGQLADVLGEEEGLWAAKVYGVSRGANFRDPHHPPATGEQPGNVLRLDDRPDRLASAAGLDPQVFQERLERVNARLLAVRDRRRQPRLDDKSLAAWNGLMISAFAVSGALLREPRYTDAAARAARFILNNMRDPASGDRLRGLLRSARSGKSGTPAFLEDYAMVIRGLVELHRTGVDPEGRALDAASDLAEVARANFAEHDGGWFDTLENQRDLFVRARSAHDGAIPSAAGSMLLALLSLADTSGQSTHRDLAVRGVVALSAEIAAAPLGAISATRALLRILAGSRDALVAALDAVGAQDLQPPPQTDLSPVEILSSTDRVEVSTQRKAALTLRVRIADTFHLTAADPGGTRLTTGLVPFRVQVIGGGGLNVYADYPAGAPYGADNELLVYKGTIDVPLLLERSGEWSGRPLLTVTYQPCTDDACLPPRTAELDVAIDAV
ncbi:MAG: hypothetical protein ACK4WH_11835, partial [Phycisphaerales bacterium]